MFKIIFPDSSTFLDDCLRTFQNKLRSDKRSKVLKSRIRKDKLSPGEQRERATIKVLIMKAAYCSACYLQNNIFGLEKRWVRVTLLMMTVAYSFACYFL